MTRGFCGFLFLLGGGGGCVVGVGSWIAYDRSWASMCPFFVCKSA